MRRWVLERTARCPLSEEDSANPAMIPVGKSKLTMSGLGRLTLQPQPNNSIPFPDIPDKLDKLDKSDIPDIPDALFTHSLTLHLYLFQSLCKFPAIH